MRCCLALLVTAGLSLGCTATTPTTTTPPKRSAKAPAPATSLAPAKVGAAAKAAKAKALPPLKLADGSSQKAGVTFTNERVVCQPKGKKTTSLSRCICLAPYTCKGGGCMFQGELSFIRRKLRSKAWAPFKYAEYGSCDDHHYIYMDKGETLGTILVFYGPDGRKIALERTSDYNEFCHRRTLHAFFGQIPACRKMVRKGVISPNPKGRTPRSAFESLRRVSHQ